MIIQLADAIFGTKPTLLVVGTVMGVVVGMVTFIRRAIAETREATRMAARFTRERGPSRSEPDPQQPGPAPDDHDDTEP